jgi:hypothetical protein
MRRTPRIIAGALVLTLLAAACGENDEPIAEVDPAVADDDMADYDTADGPHTFRVTLTNTSGDFPIAASGAQAVPIDGTEAGPTLPGGGYEFVIPRSDSNLSFATMFVQTNEWFWSAGPTGLSLLDADGTAVSGDVTDQISLWDAGTEADQTPGEGADQAPRQSGPNAGESDPVATVRAVDGFDAADYLTVALTPNDDGSTTVRIDNISADAGVARPIAPVAWAVHNPETASSLLVRWLRLGSRCWPRTAGPAASSKSSRRPAMRTLVRRRIPMRATRPVRRSLRAATRLSSPPRLAI